MIILCQSCVTYLKFATKEIAIKAGWKLDDDPYMPHWYCPDCKESGKEKL